MDREAWCAAIHGVVTTEPPGRSLKMLLKWFPAFKKSGKMSLSLTHAHTLHGLVFFYVLSFLALRHVGSWIPNQGLNSQSLHWKVKFYPLDCKGSPGNNHFQSVFMLSSRQYLFSWFVFQRTEGSFFLQLSSIKHQWSNNDGEMTNTHPSQDHSVISIKVTWTLF